MTGALGLDPCKQHKKVSPAPYIGAGEVFYTHLLSIG